MMINRVLSSYYETKKCKKTWFLAFESLFKRNFNIKSLFSLSASAWCQWTSLEFQKHMNKRKYFSMIIFTIFSVIFFPQLYIYIGRTELGYSSAHIYEKKVLKTQILNIILYYLTKWIIKSCRYAHCWMLNEWGNLQLHWGCWQTQDENTKGSKIFQSL